MKQIIHSFFLVGILAIFGTDKVIAQAPVANFSSSITSGCTPIVVQFTDLSTNNPTSWSWDLGNGTLTTLQNPSTTYVTPGTYTVILTAANASGSNTKTSVAYIITYPTPTVAFTANDLTATCASKTVQFTNTSVSNSSGAVSYYWDFGDGTLSTAQNPSHTYVASGNYSVSLVVTNSAGCNQVLNKSNYIIVAPKPTASFTASNNNSCSPPLIASFSNTSTGATSYQWDFGDGATSNVTSPTHNYAVAGSYTVRLIAVSSSGCRDTLTQTNVVNIGNLVAGFNASASSACTGNTITFTNTTTPGAGNNTWYFGDGSTSNVANPSHAYNNPGTYTVKLVVNYNNCADSATKTIVINPSPSVNFSANNTAGCTLPFTVQFSNGTVGATSYLWDFGDGTTSTAINPTHTYTTANNFNVKLTATSAGGCISVLQLSSFINVNTASGASIGINGNNNCAPAGMSFYVLNAPAAITSYSWNFGDGGTSTSSSPGHIYTAPGTYPVTLNITLSNGCAYTITNTANVTMKPTASFTASPTAVCANYPVNFSNTSSIGTIHFSWSFGDGGTSVDRNPIYVYSAPGTYTVRLIASDGICSDTFTVVNMITVLPPKAIFSVITSCSNRHQVSFVNNSLGASTYEWSFGDGSPLFTGVTPPPHNYPANGTYNIRLYVTNATTGCYDSLVRQIKIFDLNPAFTASPTTICKNSPVSFTGQANSNYTSYKWDFGDGTNITTTTATASHIYTAPGNYSVMLTVSGVNNCKDSLLKAAYIHVNGIIPSFTRNPSGGCGPISVNFTDASTSTGGAIVSRTWRFGDGNSVSSTNLTTSHLYSASGSYNVTLIVTDVNGCIDSITQANNIIVTKPAASFTSSAVLGCEGQGISFTNTSTGTAPLSFAWDFGDGGTSTANNASHTYVNVGTYTVRLIATDGNGCKDTLIRPAYINISKVTAGFTTNDTLGYCPPFTANFTNASTGATSYQWDFGNGNTSTAANPSAVYTTAGTFTVTLRAYSANGCVDSMKKTVKINAGPTGTISYTPVNGCFPVSISFTATSQNTTSIVWDYDNGVTQATAGNMVTYTYTRPGAYLPKVILSNANGCSVAVIGGDTIKVNKLTAGFIAAPDPVCVAAPVTFMDTSKIVTGPVVSRSWSFGDATTGTGAIITHAYATAGTYTVRLIASTQGGCADTAYRTITVNPLPVISGSDQSVCLGDSVVLSASGGVSYSWSPATGLSCTNCASPYANPTTTTTYTVTATNASGCTSAKSITVTVNPLPNVSAGSNVSICNGTSANLNATGAATYSWSPATGLNNPNISNPAANPSATTTYTVTGTSTVGCKNTAQVTVTVIANPTLTVTPNQTICAGDSATLTASGAATFTWSPSTGLSTTTGGTVIAKPTVTTTYTVLGNTVTNGCQAAGSVTVTVNPKPTISAGSNRTLCLGDSTVLTATGAATYVWSPATGLSCTTCANPYAKPSATTTYTITSTSGVGCTATGTVTVIVNPLPTVSAGNNLSVCAGSGVALNATGASTYVWSPATGLSCTACAWPVANPTTTTTYTVTGTNANGCKNTAQVTITVNPRPAIATSNISICPGGSGGLLATGGVTYSWSPATGLSCTNCANPTASPSATTTYTVTGTDANGCTNTATAIVTINATPSITVTGNRSFCAGDSTQLTASGAASYTWSPATGLSCSSCANPVAKPAATTTYTVTGTSGIGCTATTTVTITVNPIPAVSAGSPQTICVGSTANLNATGAATYVWSPATGLSCTSCANPVASPAATTTYTVVGTSAAGCSNKDSVKITVAPKPTVATAGISICPGSTGNLLATGAVSYLWSPATGLSCTNCANPVASPAATTVYTVIGTNADGCTNSATATVTVNPTPVINVAGTRSICAGTSTTLTASGAATYVWSPATNLSCTNCASPVANPAATTTYTVTGTSGPGCTATTTVTITVNPVPVVTTGPAQTSCAGSPVNLSASGAATYVWTPATALNCTTCANPVASPTTTTTYVVTGTTAAGCSNTANVTITVNPLPPVNAGPGTSVCMLTSAQLHASGAVSYAWAPAGTLSCATCASPVATPASTTTYTVTGTDGSGCTNTDNVTVSIYTQPPVNAGPDQTICAGESAQLQASGASAYVWSPAVTLSCAACPAPLAIPVANTTYQVIGTDVHGCVDSDKVVISIIQKGPVGVGPGGDICAGESVQLSASGGSSYQWIPDAGLNDANIPNPVAMPTGNVTYQVIIKQGTCFTDTLSATVNVHPIPTVNAGPDQNVLAGSTVQLNPTATNVATYVWSPSDGLNCTTCPNPVASPTKTTNYTVDVASDFGCKSSDEVTLFVTCDGKQLWMPNTFTPNADGQNDRFYPHGRGITTVKRFRIYDRWGELIYDISNMPVDDANYGWDGTYKNQPLKPDVYVYIVNAECTTGEPLEVKGDISLIR